LLVLRASVFAPDGRDCLLLGWEPVGIADGRFVCHPIRA